MSLIELFILAVGLSMDAFAVAVCKGLSLRKANLKNIFTVGLYFGFFQALMPYIGYYLGISFAEKVMQFDHWIAFILLTIIGINMIIESFNKEIKEDSSLNFKDMIILSVATSIDALTCGVTFAFLNVDIIFAVSFIGITTFILSSIGVKVGCIFGGKSKSLSEKAGGIILILIGTKILIEHLFF